MRDVMLEREEFRREHEHDYAIEDCYEIARFAIERLKAIPCKCSVGNQGLMKCKRCCALYNLQHQS